MLLWFFFIWIFCHFPMICLSVDLPFFLFYFNGCSLCLLDVDVYFLPQLVEIFTIIHSAKMYPPFSTSYSFGTPFKRMLLLFGVADFPKCMFVMQYFNFPLLSSFISPIILSSMSHPHSSASFSLEVIISNQFHISVTTFKISCWLVFRSFLFAIRVSLMSHIFSSSTAGILMILFKILFHYKSF